MRSPSFLSPISLKRLGPSEDIKITLEVGISWKQREVEGGIGKKEIKCFSGTRAVSQIKTEEIKAALFKRSGTSIYLSNIREVLIRRIVRLIMKVNNNNELTLFFVFRYT